MYDYDIDALGCQLGDKEYKSGDDAMADVDVAAYSFALYEDFKDYGGPVCTVEVYGVPQALFKEKFGKKFNSDKLYDFFNDRVSENAHIEPCVRHLRYAHYPRAESRCAVIQTQEYQIDHAEYKIHHR